jgi:hypothetical protein
MGIDVGDKLRHLAVKHAEEITRKNLAGKADKEIENLRIKQLVEHLKEKGFDKAAIELTLINEMGFDSGMVIYHLLEEMKPGDFGGPETEGDEDGTESISTDDDVPTD